MDPLSGMGRLLILLGAVLILVGAVFVLADKIPWLGRFPGDFYVQRRNFTFYFPLTTSILISVVLSLVLYLLSRR
jgi:membrane protein implicated in regulation of membrane protease activity